MKPVSVNLAEKLSTFSDHWSPKIVSQFNGHDVMVVKFQGEFPGTTTQRLTIFSWSLKVK